MATVTNENQIEIFEGTALASSTTVTYLGLGSQGTLLANRILTHPTSGLAPIVYSPPDETLNLDNDVLSLPDAAAQKTLTTTQLIRMERDLDDVIVTEIWNGSDQRASMHTAFWRSLYEYAKNAPASGSYITWQPRDKNAFTYNVEIVSLGTPGAPDELNVKDIRARGGSVIKHGLAGVTTVDTGVVDKSVRLAMLIVSKVT